MKPALVLTIGLLLLTLLNMNSITFYYGQLLPHVDTLINMGTNAAIIILLFLFAQKVSIWLK